MNLRPPFGRTAVILALLTLLALPLAAGAAETEKMIISARIVSVAPDASTAVINRGKAERIIPGSPVVIRPNRGEDEADISWDIPFAKGVVQSVGKDSSVVKLTDVWQDIQFRDYCAVEAAISLSFAESDLGRIALFDIVFLDQAKNAPLFTLAGLLGDSSPRATEAILDKLLAEIRGTAPTVLEERFRAERIKGGLFNGLTIQEVFRGVTRQHVERFVEYAAWLSAGLVNYDQLLIDSFADWAYAGAASGEPEKRRSRSRPVIQKGNDLLAKGEFDAALAEYRQALVIDPENAEAKKRIETSNRVLERLRMLQEDDKDVTARRALGLDLYQLGLYARAVEELQKARDLGDDSVEVRRYQGFAQSNLAHYPEARAILEPLATERPDDADIGRWLIFIGQKEAIAREGRNVASLLAIGDVYYQYGLYDEAVQEFNGALELAPKDPEVWKRIGRADVRRRASREEGWAKESWQKGQFDLARSHWTTALSQCQEIGDTDGRKSILRAKGSRAFGSEFYAEAVETYRALLELDPKDAAAHLETAKCYDHLGDYDQAVKWTEQALALDPKNFYAYNILGTIHENAGRIDQAMANYQKAVDISPAFKDALYNLGRLYALRGEYGQAADLFRRALEADDDFGMARSRLIAADGVIEARARLKATPGSGFDQLRLVKSLFLLDDYDRAIAVLQDALRSEPNRRWAYEQLGQCYIRQSKYKEGLAALDEGYKLYPKPDILAWKNYAAAQTILKDNPDDAGAIIMLGEDSLYWQSWDAALMNFAKAQDLGADPDIVSAYMERARKGQEETKQLGLAAGHYGRGQFEEAAGCARRSLELARELKDLRGQVDALLWSGWSAAARFKHEEALRAYNEAGLIASALGDDVVTAKYANSLGGYYISVGEYGKAMDEKRTAADLWHVNNMVLNEAWSALPGIGWLKSRLGDPAGEIACYEQALAFDRRLVYPKGEASALLSLAYAYERQGDFSRAIGSFEQALAIARARGFSDSALSAYAGLGDIYAELGDIDNARKHTQNHLDLAQALGNKAERANALNEFGLLYLEEVKDYARALGYFRDSLALARLIDYRLAEGVAAANIAVVYSRQGNYAEALARHEDALRIIREFKDKSLEMQGLNEKGETYLGLKQYDQAIACQLEAREIAVFLGARSEQWLYELAAGKAFEAKGDFPKAIDSYKNAAETLRSVKSRIANEKLLKGFNEQERQTDVYKRLSALLMKSGRAEEAFSYVEESKSKIVKDAFGDVKPATSDADLKQTLQAVDQAEAKRDALQQELQEEKKKPEEARNALKVETLTKTLAATEGEFNQWMLKLKFQNRKMYDALTIKPATLGDVQRQVPAGAVFLMYFISPEELYVFCIGREFFLARSTAIPEADLNTLVSRFVRLCQEPPASGPDERVFSQGRRLYQVLIGPVEDIVDKYETVVIVPFGPLYYLPFHALVKDTDGQPGYLIERKRIGYATSATFADILEGQARGHKNFVGFGNPDGSLPAAAEELQGLKDKVFRSGAKIYTAGQATKEAFFAQAKTADILHLATHGTIEANSLESYLLFAGPTAESRKLTLYDIAGYVALREKNSLVFLSACQTAKEATKSGSGSELITLAEAFAMAGSPTLIATLWEVDDAATRTVAETFYDQLANKNKDKLDALRAGQLALIRTPEFAHPFFWASFLMIGSWR
jgi:tetratricopeptide (TPR) repeat protein